MDLGNGNMSGPQRGTTRVINGRRVLHTQWYQRRFRSLDAQQREVSMMPQAWQRYAFPRQTLSAAACRLSRRLHADGRRERLWRMFLDA